MQGAKSTTDFSGRLRTVGHGAEILTPPMVWALLWQNVYTNDLGALYKDMAIQDLLSIT